MKTTLLSAAVAAIVSAVVVYVTLARESNMGAEPTPAASAPTAAPAPTAIEIPGALSLSYTDALVEDVWVNGARQAGDDHRSLTDADHSICFITKIELSGIQAPEDTSSCAMQIDDFTGFWDLVATAEEGSQSEIRCNARCLVWE